MKVSILIPAYNEGKTIRRTIESCLFQTRPADEIIIVNDGSTDDTLQILQTFGERIIIVDLKKNTGNKSLAQEQGLPYITGDIFVATDADTLLHPNFIEEILPNFNDPEVGAVAGYVKSLKNNWLTASREVDYAIGQEIYKTAQSFIGFILIIPGCAAAFRTRIMKEEIRFDHDTVTEDLDFTYQLHELGHKIAFEKNAISFTQDPPNISSYIRQMRRWYGGGFENLQKHFFVISKKPSAAFELSLSYADSLSTSILIFLLPLLNLSLFSKVFLVFVVPQAIIFCVFTAIHSGRPDILKHPFGYLVTRFINSAILLDEFTRTIIFKQKQATWLKSDRISI